MHRSSFCNFSEALASGESQHRLRDASSDLRRFAGLVLNLSKEAGPSVGDTLLRPRLLVKYSVVNTSEEDGAWLEASDGKRHALHGSSSLGRTGANRIVLESPKVSRQHALIHLQNIGEFWLIDFGSSNGTFVNKRRIHHPIRLSDGDQITIGDQVLTFRQPVPSSREPKMDLLQRTLREIENIPCWLLVA